MRVVQTEDGPRNWITTGWVLVGGQWCEQGYFEGSPLPANQPDLAFDQVAGRLNSYEVALQAAQRLMIQKGPRG